MTDHARRYLYWPYNVNTYLEFAQKPYVEISESPLLRAQSPSAIPSEVSKIEKQAGVKLTVTACGIAEDRMHPPQVRSACPF